MGLSAIQYTLVIIVVVVFLLIVWGGWCGIVIKIVNLVVNGLGAPIISNQMCNNSLSLLDRIQKWVTNIQLPEIRITHTNISSDFIIQLLLVLGLILLFFLFGSLIYFLTKKNVGFIKESWDGLMDFARYMLPGIGYKITEKIIGKHIGDKQHDTILFLTADPTNESRLRLGEEFREIQEKLQLGRYRKRFNLVTRMSVRSQDVSQALLDLKPKIVHFSGHGTSEGALCFENETGQSHLVQPDALAALFEQFTNQVKCVILNACYSETQAKAIAGYIGYVIGMNQAIGDKAAIAFTIGFYQAIGAGRTFEDAYKLGCIQIGLHGIPGHLTPVLIKDKYNHL